MNPYGKSKLMVEGMLSDICTTHDFNAVCFRYFNAAGADELGIIGEAREPETHLIPNILKSISSGTGDLKVFGGDYEIPDSTCPRDYVHVNVLAQAHLLGSNNVGSQSGFSAFNLGNGNGFSVLEVIESCQQVTGAEVRYPASLISDSALAKDVLGWSPELGPLDQIIESAWRWRRNQ